MLTCARIIPAVHRKCAISKKIGGARPRASPPLDPPLKFATSEIKMIENINYELIMNYSEA